jgi:hypothetical protein
MCAKFFRQDGGDVASTVKHTQNLDAVSCGPVEDKKPTMSGGGK